MKRAPHADVDSSTEPCHVSLQHHLSVAVDGVADKQVQTAEFSNGLLHHLIDGFHGRNVGGHNQCLPAKFTNLFRDFVRLVPAGMAIDDNIRPLSSQLQSHRRPNALR